MSLERACVNCERCYGLSETVFHREFKKINDEEFEDLLKKYNIEYDEERFCDDEKYEEDLIELLFRNKDYRKDILSDISKGVRVVMGSDSLIEAHRARNEAMKALQDEKMFLIHSSMEGQMRNLEVSEEFKKRAEYTEKALQACRSCSYEEPRIVKAVEERKNYL